MDNDPWRRNAIKAAVNRGTQDPRDLDDIKANGRLTLVPESRRLCLALAKERALEVDTMPLRKRRG